jgi:toxin ParE1/3/4
MQKCLKSIRYSSRAEADLAEILDYSTDKWGEGHAISYLTDFVMCFEKIAKLPDLGRACDSIHPGFRRIARGSHVIFYRPARDGVFISRVLHQSMLPTRDQFL